jgi:hypothetical protein
MLLLFHPHKVHRAKIVHLWICKCFAVLCPPPKQQTAVLSRLGRSLKRFQYNTTELTARNKLPRIRIHVIVTGEDVVTSILMKCCRKENMKSGLRSSVSSSRVANCNDWRCDQLLFCLNVGTHIIQIIQWRDVTSQKNGDPNCTAATV